MDFALLLIAVALVVYVVRFVRHRKDGQGVGPSASAVVRDEHRDRFGFTLRDQHAEADRLQALNPALGDYAALRQARKNLTAKEDHL